MLKCCIRSWCDQPRATCALMQKLPSARLRPDIQLQSRMLGRVIAGHSSGGLTSCQVGNHPADGLCTQIPVTVFTSGTSKLHNHLGQMVLNTVGRWMSAAGCCGGLLI